MPRYDGRQKYVGKNGSPWKQRGALEYHGHVRLGFRCAAIDAQLACSRNRQAGKHAQQSGFATAARPHDGDEMVLGDRKRDIPQRLDGFARPREEGHAYALQGNEGIFTAVLRDSQPARHSSHAVSQMMLVVVCAGVSQGIVILSTSPTSIKSAMPMMASSTMATKATSVCSWEEDIRMT